MKVLLTGASSFTGYWFAHSLAAAGVHVVAPLRLGVADYGDGIRAERVRRLARVSEIVEHSSFGSDRFLDIARAGSFDVLCHHAARVGDYRSPDFDISGALEENTHNLRAVLEALSKGGLKGVVLTGSVFEQNEGAGEHPLVAFSPYGISKGLTAEVVRYRCREAGLIYGKFVIPNPFGPLEEPRFCNYLIRTWRKGETAAVNTPAYVRDNIHVMLLARAYVRFVAEHGTGGQTIRQMSPSGYIESQGSFALRFASAMRSRLGMACEVELRTQSDFSEPLMRVNTDNAERYVTDWDEETAWNEVADFYRI
ncbi:NAD-dependent epimerase/dehydratase family protein [Camelimonas lactis]|uniref:Nucleoside-diphosphate-sugar epimerase n=1 Tax=Camelimonas lactis TaxID=659006 RepID=A0A4R2GUN0_9HYPH|nr:NAD(P)-dependent oxidoreductase [Camelimonas lactis]TCO14499.1 nucleoside-diphosphate-sugar epimerase [Camelimonas lactis]